MQPKTNDIYLGSHVSFSSPKYFEGTVLEALSFNENTFMFYTGAPQNSIRTPLEKCKIEEGLKLIEQSGINKEKIVVHAPYLINLGNIDENKFTMSKNLLASEIKRTAAFGMKLIVLHPGAHMNNGVEVGLKQVIRGLDEILDEDDSDVIICLETMAGKGSELGRNFEELAYIIKNSKHSDRLGVCFDTCHTFDSGLNIDDIDEILNKFDKTIGLEKLKVIHLNDSKNPIGSHKDRHENIGKGNIGLNTLLKYVYHEKLKDVPKILETPYINGFPPYKEEIELIRSFNKN